MAGLATAIGVAAAAGIAGSVISSNAAESAAQTQAGAAENAQAISQNEFNTITGQEQPFMQSGYGALGQLNYLQGIGKPGTAASPTSGPTASSSPSGGYGSLNAPFTADTFKQFSPAYQFQLQQGIQGTLNGEAASNGALSGAAQKDLMSYNQNLANTSFNSAFNQYQTQQGNIYSRLAGIAQLGQNAAANTGQQGTTLAGQAAQSATNIGTAQAAGTVGAANAFTGGLNSLSALPWLYQATSAPAADYGAYGGGYAANGALADAGFGGGL